MKLFPHFAFLLFAVSVYSQTAVVAENVQAPKAPLLPEEGWTRFADGVVGAGPRGGCYYINSSGKKTYVDHSYCS